jgi:hypothetical protein
MDIFNETLLELSRNIIFLINRRKIPFSMSPHFSIHQVAIMEIFIVLRMKGRKKFDWFPK